MLASLQILSACLVLLVVLFIFATPVLDLESTALRAKQFAESVLLGLAFLASVLIGWLFQDEPSRAFRKHMPPGTHLRIPSLTPALLSVFRC